MIIELSSELQKQYDDFLNCFIEYPQISTIYDCFDRLRFFQRRHAELSNYQGSDVPCMLLSGDSGSGKSALINHYRKIVLTTLPSGSKDIPVLVVRIPEIPELEKLLAHMLSELDHFGADYRLGRSRELGLTKALFKVLRYKKTELIIINEVQELIEYKTPKECTAISNRLKYISEESGVPIVFVGMPWAEKILEDPQWQSRITYTQFLPYFKVSDKEQKDHFVKIVNGLFMRMGFDIPPMLNDAHTIKALFSVCSGQMRSLKHLLNDALYLALSQNDRTITEKHLSEAYDLKGKINTNPFPLPIEKIIIKEVKDYSRLNTNAHGPDDRILNTQFMDILSISQVLKKGR